MDDRPDFSAARLKKGELALIREAYMETYPVRTLVNHVDELVEALREAKENIKVWHNMGGNESVWDIYDRNAPEMKRLNAALKCFESDRGTAE